MKLIFSEFALIRGSNFCAEGDKGSYIIKSYSDCVLCKLFNKYNLLVWADITNRYQTAIELCQTREDRTDEKIDFSHYDGSKFG